MAATMIEKVVAWIGIYFLDPGSQTGLNAVAKVSSSLAQRQYDEKASVGIGAGITCEQSSRNRNLRAEEHLLGW
jgi:hypothetical protein